MSSSNLSPPQPIVLSHDMADFDSGEPSLDSWLKARALRNRSLGASSCFVICADNTVIGYYCLSAGAIGHADAPKNMRRNLPDPLPVLLLGRLAIDRRHQNRGLARALLRDAMIRAVSVSASAGVFAILVHALSEPAKRFYLSRGFVASPLQPMTMLMTLQTVRSALAMSDGDSADGL